MAALQAVAMLVGAVCILSFAALLALWLYVVVMQRLIARAWEPVEALAQEIADEQERDASYIRWLESTWNRQESQDS